MSAAAVSASPAQLVAAARVLCDREDEALAGRWPRAAALLARQALEGALDEYWRSRFAGAEDASAKAKLLCLPTYLKDPVARNAYHAWTALSRACHVTAYELSPTRDELESWLTDVEAVIAATTVGES